MIKKWLIRILSALFLMVIIVYSTSPVYTLHISCCTDRDSIIFRKVLTSQDKLKISYEHSLYKVRQEENFIINKDMFMLDSMYFGNYAAYDYYDHQSNGKVSELPDGSYLITQLAYSLKTINFRNANYSNHIVTINDEITLNLGELAPRGEIISITIKREGWLTTLIRGEQND